MDWLAFLGIVVGIILGIIEIRNYLVNSPSNRSFVRFILGSSFIFIAIGFVVNFLYFAPKAKAEEFINAFRTLNTYAILNTTCPNSPLVYEFTGANGSLVTFVSLFSNVVIDSEQFTPPNQYRFSWSISSIAGQEQKYSSTIDLKTMGLAEYCVLYVSGLNQDSSGSSNSTIETVPTTTIYDQGWSLHIVGLEESPSEERGWKNVSVKVVFESTSPVPYPLYYAKYIEILDSTGNWRRGDLCCSKPGWTADEVIRLPEGMRFRLDTQQVKIPENATAEQFRVQICGSYECSQQYAVFTYVIDEITSDNFVFHMRHFPQVFQY